jgi:hypothetical protein
MPDRNNLPQPPRPVDDNIIDIDLNRLDYEWWRQPGLRKLWGDRRAAAREHHSNCEMALELAETEAKVRLEQAKDNLAQVEASLGIQIRNDPQSYGIEKSTDKPVEAAVICQTTYQNALYHLRQAAVPLDHDVQKAKERLVQAKKRLDYADTAVAACEHRRNALEKEVEMQLGGLYPECRLPKDMNEEDRERLKDVGKAGARTRGNREPPPRMRRKADAEDGEHAQ